MTKPFSLSKHERLKSKNDIDTLFLTGKAFFVFPFKIVYQKYDTISNDKPLLFGVSVPKRNFKHAVDRNRIKRLIRELYRVNKTDLKNEMIEKKQSLHIMFLYIHNEILSYSEMKPMIEDVMHKINGRN